jgi:hypothetical protein
LNDGGVKALRQKDEITETEMETETRKLLSDFSNSPVE